MFRIDVEFELRMFRRWATQETSLDLTEAPHEPGRFVSPETSQAWAAWLERAAVQFA